MSYPARRLSYINISNIFYQTALRTLKLFLVFFLLTEILHSQDTILNNPHYKRNDANILENYNTNDKEKYFPLRSTGVWTELNPKVPRVDYIGVDFINPDTGWAVGLYGAVIKTTNAGQSWKTIPTTTGEILLKVHSYNGQVVMVVGHNGTILRSSDGGESFSLLTGITTQELWGVKMLNDTLGWICGRNNTLLKTTDAGLTWQPVVTGYNYHYWQFDFFPAPSGTADYFMIACSGGKVLKTTNGGQSFTEYQAGSTQDLYTIDIIDSLHIAAAGNYGKNVYSSDGGLTWIENQYTALSINWIQYINRDTGYITIGTIASFYKTTNRGLTWFNPGFNAAGEWQFELLTGNLPAGQAGLGYGVGAGLTVTKTEDGFYTGYNLFLNKNWSDVFFINEMKGFFASAALGEKLYKTEDGGITYEIIENSPEWNYDILFLDSLTGFSGSSTIYKTTDGGENWYATNGAGQATKIFFINPLIGWAVGGSNIYKTTDGGENWFVQIALPADSYTSIYFIDSLNGWATSRYIWQTTNGGTNWIQRTDVQLYFNRNIYFTSIDTGFVTVDMTNTGSHDLYKTTNGGISWLKETRIETAYTIHTFPNKYHWISNGWSLGQVFETTDNGSSWEEISGNLPAIFGQFHSPIEYVGYAVSGYGLILKYFDTTYVPVELTQFTARYSLNKIELNWLTASEVNNYGFEVWKSSDLKYWGKIGFVHGGGTSTEIRNYSFYDFKIESEQLCYKIKQIDFDGSYNFSEVISVKIPIENFVLTQNYPNPANPSTHISFTIPQRTSVKIELFSISGEKVQEILNEEKERGIYNIEIDLKKYASSIYYYRMTTNSGYTATKKLILIK